MENEKVFGVYIRVSTGKQALEGDSIEMQENLAKDIIKEEGGILYKVYLEAGVSASRTNMDRRPALMECLNDIEAGMINHLIVYRRDRLARNSEDSIIIRNKIKRAKCEVIFSASGEQEMDLDDMYSPIMENLRAGMDELEAEQTSVRVSDTMIDKAKRGEFSGGNVTYGYKNENGYLKPIESEIPVIREIEDLYLQGYGVFTICKWLNNIETKALGKRGVSPKKLKQHKRSSPHWTKETVEAILFNPTYSGFMSYQSYKNEGMEPIIKESKYIEPIRTNERQLTINQERSKRRASRRAPIRYNTPFLLTGLLQCSECGSDYISASSQRKDGARYSYYKCRKKDATNHTKCHSKTYKKEIIEAHILHQAKKYVQEFLNSDVYEIVQKKLSKNEGVIENNLDEIERNLQRSKKDFQSLRRLILELNPDDATYEMMRDAYQDDQRQLLLKIKDLEKTKTKLEEQLESQDEKKIDIEAITRIAKDFNESIDNAPINIQKRLVDNLFKNIYVDINGEITMEMAIEVKQKDSLKEVSFIEVGGVGDTTTPQSINFINLDKARKSNVFKWLRQIIEAIRNTFYEFLISVDSDLQDPEYFQGVTDLSVYSHKGYRNKLHAPYSDTFNRILSRIDSSSASYVQFLFDKGYNISTTEIKLALDGQNFLKGAECSENEIFI